MIGLFAPILILGAIILALALCRIDVELGRKDGFISDLFIIFLAGVGIALLGMVGIVICTVG